MTDPTAKGAARTANTVARVLLEAVQKLEGGNAVDPSLGDDDKPAKATVRGVVSGKAQVPTLPSGPSLPLYLLTGAGLGGSCRQHRRHWGPGGAEGGGLVILRRGSLMADEGAGISRFAQFLVNGVKR